MKFLYIFILLATTLVAKAQDNYNFHSIYLYNFIKNTDWPAGKGKVVIGIAGDSKAAWTAFEKMANTKSTEESKISLVSLKSASDMQEISVLFIPSDEKKSLDYIKNFKGKPVLIVTENGEKDSSIAFVKQDSKLKFKVNKEIVSAAGLKVSSSLLALSL